MIINNIKNILIKLQKILENDFYNILFTLFTFVLNFLITFKFDNKNIRFLLYLLLLLILVYYYDKNNFYFYIMCGFYGIIGEILCMNVNDKTWKYYDNQLNGSPYWLYPMWGIAAVYIIYGYKLLSKLL